MRTLPMPDALSSFTLNLVSEPFSIDDEQVTFSKLVPKKGTKSVIHLNCPFFLIKECLTKYLLISKSSIG